MCHSLLSGIHPGRLTWNIIMEAWKIIFLKREICRFQPLIFQGVKTSIKRQGLCPLLPAYQHLQHLSHRDLDLHPSPAGNCEEDGDTNPFGG